jgi:toxin YoeB
VSVPLEIIESKQFLADYDKLKLSVGTIKKLKRLLIDIRSHPRIGLGKPEPLAGSPKVERWSRRISHQHRLVYEIKSSSIILISCYGHYSDH